MAVFIVFKCHEISGIGVKTVCREYGGYGVGLSGLEFPVLGGQDLYAVLTLYYPYKDRTVIDAVSLIGYFKGYVTFITHRQAFKPDDGVTAHLYILAEVGE